MKLLQDLGMEYPNSNSKQKQRYGIYECPVCTNAFRTQQRYVNEGRSKQCKDCNKKQSKNTKHGLESHELYGRWQSMKQRCYNPKNRDYVKYGAKGVTVCSEWIKDFKTYYDWCMLNGYRSDLFLDKDIKCNQQNIHPKIYSPTTCMFVSMKRNSQEASGIKVIQKSLDGTVLAEFNSYSDAARSLQKSLRKQIKKCCIGILPTVEGFLWEAI